MEVRSQVVPKYKHTFPHCETRVNKVIVINFRALLYLISFDVVKEIRRCEHT